MAQATSSVNQLVHQFVQWLQAQSLQSAERISRWSDRFRTKPDWLAAAAVALLLIWNWQLVLSLGLGLGVMVWVYLTRQGWWQPPKAWNLHKLWSRANRSLTLAVASGGVAAMGSYLAIAMWRSERSWLATGIIVEGTMILMVLLLMAWQTLHRHAGQLANDCGYQAKLADLADADPLKRLIAVRLLTQQTIASPPLLLKSAELADCFRLMLNRETEPVVCSALLDGLRSLAPSRRLEAGKTQPFSVPMPTKSRLEV